MARPSLLFIAAAMLPSLSRGEITPGEILISEMNCVACHAAPSELKARLASRTSPKLGKDGVRVTPQWLREFLADPLKTKPGTLMPDMLHSLQRNKRDR
jgi:cytochrome c2